MTELTTKSEVEMSLADARDGPAPVTTEERKRLEVQESRLNFWLTIGRIFGFLLAAGVLVMLHTGFMSFRGGALLVGFVAR